MKSEEKVTRSARALPFLRATGETRARAKKNTQNTPTKALETRICMDGVHGDGEGAVPAWQWQWPRWLWGWGGPDTRGFPWTAWWRPGGGSVARAQQLGNESRG